MAQDFFFNPASLTVMVVDDHDPIRKATKRVLANMGFHEIIECFDGDEALKILHKKPVDLLILDLYMRNVSGFQILEYIRNRDIGSDIPVIVCTGEASKEEIVKVADMGADTYLLKPFQAADLEKKITSVLNSYYSPSTMIKNLRNAERFVLSEDYDSALKIYDVVIKADPSSARAVHGKAMALLRQGRDQDAQEILVENIKINHSFHKHYRTLADSYLRQNKVKDAIEAMKRETEINPKQVDRQIQLANLLLKEGDAMGAVDHYRVALQEDPKRLIALMGMGHAYAQVDNLDKALYYFKRVRRYHPSSTKALEAAVRCAVSSGEPKKAELFLKDEKATHPAQTDTYILLSYFFQKMERDEEAIGILNELLERDPENVLALKIKGQIYLRKGDMKNAFTILSDAVKVAPSSETFTLLGETQVALSMIPESLDSFTKAIALNPDEAKAVFLLAVGHQNSQQWIKAMILFRRAGMLGYEREKCAAEVRECMSHIHGRRRTRMAS